MAVKRPGLGRGLDALLGGAPAPQEESPFQVPPPLAPVTAVPPGPEGVLRRLPIDLIRRGKYQPRTGFDTEALQELADSIRAQGVVQPIVVRPDPDGNTYELIAGERRWRAAQMAGLHEIPAIVRNATDQATIAMALIENIQRQNLNPLDEAAALQRLMTEFDMTHQGVAEAVGRSRTAVTNMLRLLGLNDDVKALLLDGKLEMGHARALLGLTGGAQSEAARQVASKGLSARETERLVRRLQAPARPAPARKAVDPDVRRLEQRLSEQLGAQVTIHHTARGSGSVVVQYNNLDELDGILSHIK
jgi:ParB family chromosome partitioning protein